VRRAPSTPTPIPNRPGYADAPVGSAAAFYSRELAEFLLPYEAVAAATDPDRVLAGFLDTTYATAAELGGWEQAGLETNPQRWEHQRTSSNR
jgi:hypothetical protein